MFRPLTYALIPLALIACGETVDPEVVSEPVAPTLVGEAPASAPAAEAVEGLVVDVGEPGETLTLTVTRGGGSTTSEVQSAQDGTAEIAWTLGIAPVDNTLTVERSGVSETLEITIRATLAEPLRAEPFGEVNAFLNEEGHDGSTEDLTFTEDGLLMGAPEGVLHVDSSGDVTRWLQDDTLSKVWGFAVDADGTLWAVDLENKRMVRIDTDGTVTEVLTTNGSEQLEGANYVAVDHDGLIYLSDPCLGQIIRFDPTTEETAVLQFDLESEGGPNGLAVSADGTELYVATENTGFLCSHADIDFQIEIAGVYVVDLDDFETKRPLAEGLGLFGDGLAFDVEGNLYVVVDTESNFSLEQSLIVVFPKGESVGVPFLVAGEETLFANLAFGQGEYGESTLYLALLSIPLFTNDESRGLERFDVGIAGLPLLP